MHGTTGRAGRSPSAGRGWRTLRWLLVGAAVSYFLAQVLRASARDLPWPVHPGRLALSVAMLAGVLAWGVVSLRAVIGALFGGEGRGAVSFAALLRVTSLSSLARYVPGGIWQFVAAGTMARGAGTDAARLVTAMLVHTAFSLAAAAIVGVWALPALATGVGSLRLRLLGTALATLVLVHPWFVRMILASARRISGRPMPGWRPGWRVLVQLLLMHVIGWIGYGASFALLVRGLVDHPAAAAPHLAAIGALAFLAGYAVLVAPAGIGVREVALSLLLAPLLGAAAPMVALAARAWSVAGDVCLVIVAAAGVELDARRTRAARRVPVDGAPSGGPDEARTRETAHG